MQLQSTYTLDLFSIIFMVVLDSGYKKRRRKWWHGPSQTLLLWGEGEEVVVWLVAGMGHPLLAGARSQQNPGGSSTSLSTGREGQKERG